MPRISQRKVLIEWFLMGIERDQAHLDQERLQDFLRRTMRQLQEGLAVAMNRSEEGDDSSVTFTVTLSESSESSDWSRSLLSSEWHDERVDHEMEMQRKLRALRNIMAKRYLRDRGGDVLIPKSTYWRNEVLAKLPYDKFRHFFCMNPDSFMRVLDWIQGHPVFKNNSRYPQVDPMVQLLVALRRLGSEASSAAGVLSVAQLFGIRDGTVVLYTNRVILALMEYWGKMVRWHTPEEKLAMRRRLQANPRHNLFKHCVGVIDGTYFAFKFKPYPDERSVQFFNYRKKFYGLQATVICDDLGRILQFSSVFPALVHDARCFRVTRLAQHPGEWGPGGGLRVSNLVIQGITLQEMTSCWRIRHT